MKHITFFFLFKNNNFIGFYKKATYITVPTNNKIVYSKKKSVGTYHSRKLTLMSK